MAGQASLPVIRDLRENGRRDASSSVVPLGKKTRGLYDYLWVEK